MTGRSFGVGSGPDHPVSFDRMPLVPATMATRASGMVAHSGARLGGLVFGAGRRGADRLRDATTVHTTLSFRNGGGVSDGPGTGPLGRWGQRVRLLRRRIPDKPR